MSFFRRVANWRRRMHQLGVVIPYRDRASHLELLLPRLEEYFFASSLSADILIVEQAPGLPFNRGALCNIGFMLLESKIDYVCFHDVDYLPIEADYSYPIAPAMLIWHGLEIRPIDPAEGTFIRNTELDTLFSAVVLLTTQQFRLANGYPNDYWGWGYEDLELKRRLRVAGFETVNRKGTFEGLDHLHNGYVAEGRPSAAHLANAERFARGRSASPKGNGLDSLQFAMNMRRVYRRKAHMKVELVQVDLVSDVRGEPASSGV